jgi:hypothetical protein
MMYLSLLTFSLSAMEWILFHSQRWNGYNRYASLLFESKAKTRLDSFSLVLLCTPCLSAYLLFALVFVFVVVVKLD